MNVQNVHLVLLVAAAICFGLAAASIPSRVNLVALGLLFWELVDLLGGVGPGR
jgi:hypothetical protein